MTRITWNCYRSRSLSLLSDEQRLSSIAEAGYENAKKNATWETTGQRFFDILYKNGRMSSV